MARDQTTLLLAFLVSSAILAVSCSPTSGSISNNSGVPDTQGANSSARATSLDLASQVSSSQRHLFLKVDDWIPKIKDCAKHLITVLQEVIGDLKECLKDGFKSCSIELCLQKIGNGLKEGIKILSHKGDDKSEYSSKRKKSNTLSETVDGIQDLVGHVGSSLNGLLNPQKASKEDKEDKETSEKPKSKSKSRFLDLFE